MPLSLPLPQHLQPLSSAVLPPSSPLFAAPHQTHTDTHHVSFPPVHPLLPMCVSLLVYSFSSPSVYDAGKAFADSLQFTFNTFVFSTALQEALTAHGLEVSNHTFTTAAAAADATTSSSSDSSSSVVLRECVNVHAVLHSPRGDGKEALVLVTPINHQHFTTGQ